MTMIVRCPKCGATYEVPAAAAGHTGECRCGSMLTVPGEPLAPSTGAGHAATPGSDSPPPPSAPSDPADDPAEDRRQFMCAEIRRWSSEGLIPRSLATRLMAEYDRQRRHPAAPRPRSDTDWPAVRIPVTPGMVLLYLGGLLVFSAAILLISNVWETLGDGGRFLLVLAPAAALYGVGAYLYHSDESRRLAGTVLIFFACLIAPLALHLGMVAVFGDARGDAWRPRALLLAAMTFAVHVGTLIRFRSPLYTLLYPGSFLWLAGQGADIAFHDWGYHADRPMAGVLLVAGLMLMGVGAYHAEKGKRAYALVPDLVGSLCALGVLVYLGADGHQPLWETLAVVASLGSIALSVIRRNSVYLFAGSLYLLTNIFAIGFEYFSKSAGLPLTLMICGGLSIAAGYAIQQVRREYLLEEPA